MIRSVKPKTSCTPRLLRYYSVDDISYWSPTKDFLHIRKNAHFSKNSKFSILLNNMVFYEEIIHRQTMMYQIIHLIMRLAEAWSDQLIEVILRDFCGKDYFRLYVPLHYNLKLERQIKMPRTLLMAIEKLITTCDTLYKCGQSCKYFIETIALYVLKQKLKTYLKSDWKKVWHSLLKIKLKRYKFLQEIYPKAERALDNIRFNDLSPLFSLMLSPNYYNGEMFLLTTRDLLSYLNRESFLVVQRFQRLIEKLNEPILNMDLFQKFAEDNGLRYIDKYDLTHQAYRLYISNDDLALFNERLESGDLLLPHPPYIINLDAHEYDEKEFFNSSSKIEYITVASLDIIEDERDTYLFFPRVILKIRLGEEIQEIEQETDIRRTRELYKAIINTITLTVLKYFLLNGRESCPFSGLTDFCQFCIISYGKKTIKKKLVLQNENVIFENELPCMIPSLLNGIDIRLVR
ncbi:MAG: hypothetical protein DRJ38_03410 [Thermoprotei archaeon]|nr:MAG: hypothetical protein DRJ38_03410 [Thermoprotei archaeon]